MQKIYDFLTEDRKNVFFEIFRTSFIFTISIFLLAPLIGIIVNFINIKWDILIVFLIIVLSGICTFYFRKLEIFKINNWLELIALIILLIFTSFIYLKYSPVLEIRQDPAVYTFKGFNLVNYGFTYAPSEVTRGLIDNGVLSSLNGYSAIQNGTELVDAKLFTDFYAGGSYFYAFFGVINKNLFFYAQSLIMLLNVTLMYFVVNKIFSRKKIVSNVMLVACFFIAPIIVYFGRGGYSEPSAMVFILLIINILLEDNKRKDVWILMLVFLSCYTARIDYLLIILIGIVVMSFKGLKYCSIYSLLAIGEVLLFQKVFWIYYDRIIQNDMPILKYGIPLIIIAYFVCFAIIKWGEELIVNIFYSKGIKYFLLCTSIVVGVLMFYDNVVSEYHMASIHGNIIMTYKEFIWDLLFMVFPSFILIGGLLNINNFIDKKRIPFLASGFMVFALFAYLYFFINAGNSPQLYWMLRRYYCVVIPLLFISFVILVSKIDRKTTMTISLTLLLLSTNMYVNSKQVPDYRGIDKCVREIDSKLKDDEFDIVLYDKSIRYKISSLMSYSDLEFIPVNYEQLSKLVSEDHLKGKKSAYITDGNLDIENLDAIISFEKMGETYGSVPESSYVYTHKLHIIDFQILKESFDEVTGDNIIFPSLKLQSTDGVYEDGWTNGSSKFKKLSIKKNNKSHLVIKFKKTELEENSNRKLIESVNLLINGQYKFEPDIINDSELQFDISNLNGEIKELCINSLTFRPSEYTKSEDTRDLGILLEKIYLK